MRFYCNDGGFEIMAEAHFIGDDLLVTCNGGDKPHIGAVAVAAQTSSGTGRPEVQLVRLAGHREDELSEAAAIKLSTALGCTVTFVAGMHWDRIDKDGINQVLENVEILIDSMIDNLPGQVEEGS